MSLITPKVKKTSPTKKITLELEFEVWNELLSTGTPREELERVINEWYMSRLQDRPTYFATNTNRIKRMDLGQLAGSETLVILREQKARAEAMGQHQKASALSNRIHEVERLLLLKDKQEQLTKESAGDA